MDLTQLFNKPSDSPEIKELLKLLNTVHVPSLDEDDIEEDLYTDWVLVKKHGVEFGFSNQEWLAGEPRYRWGAENLVLSQLYFYNADKEEGIAQFKGELPYGLTFSDTREQVLQKMQKVTDRHRFYKSDTWDIEDKRLNVIFENKRLQKLYLFLPEKPFKEPLIENRQTLSMDLLIQSLEKPIDKNLPFLSALAEPLSKDHWEEWSDTGELTLTDEYGIELYSYENKKKKVVLGSVKFFAARDRESIGWTGDLPYGLSFEMSPSDLYKKFKKKPAEQSDDVYSGYALWHFEKNTLHVLYSNIDNRLSRVQVGVLDY